MREKGQGRQGLRHIGFALALLLSASIASAAITAVPNSVSIYPGQTSSVVTLNCTFTVTTFSGTANVFFGGLPPGTSTTPNPVSFTFTTGQTSAAPTFQFTSTTSTPPGTYTISMREITAGAGSGSMTLVVLTPTIAPSASPTTINLVKGGASVPVTANVNPTPGFTQAVTFDFIGLPAGVSFGSPQTVNSPYPPAVFNLVAGAGATPGSYPANLRSQYGTSGVTTQLVPVTIVIAPYDIGVTLGSPSMNLCGGAPAQGNTINLTPLNGYSGTPAISFTGVPAGVTITPPTPTAAAMPPGQSVPFTVSANGSVSGTQIITVHVNDASAGIAKTATLTLNITQPDYTPSVSPNSVNIVAGGASQTINAIVTPNSCFSGSATVTPSIAQPGITFSPASQAVSSSAPFTVSATSAVPPGAYTATFSFNVPGLPKTQTATINVAPAPDFTLSAAPPSGTVAPGGSTTVTISNTALNGFAGTVNVTAPTIANITFTPSSFTIPAGGSQSVTVTAAPGATPGGYSSNFTATAAGVTGTKSAPYTINVTAAPDFTIAAAPLSQSVVAGGASQTFVVSATGLNGFAGSINVSAPSIAGLTFAPASFTLAPGGSQNVTVSAASSTAPGSYNGNFTATASSVAGTKTAPVSVTVTPAPNYTLTASPSAFTASAGSTVTTNLTVTPQNGFSSSVSMTSSAPAGFTVTPPSASLSPNVALPVQIAIAPGTGPGTYTINFTTTTPGIAAKTASVSITLTAAPDVQLTAIPGALSLTPGSSQAVTLNAIAINGFSGQLTVTAPTVNNLTFSPASFTLTPGTPVNVNVTAAPGITPGTYSGDFTATSAGLSGPRSAPVTVTVGAGSDFSIAVAPAALNTIVDQNGSVVVTLTPINGFQGFVNVVATAPPGVTISPSTFTLSGAAPQQVTISSSLAGTNAVVFTATSGSITHTAAVTLTTARALDFNLTVAPAAISLRPGESTQLTFNVPATGFVPLITITMPQVADVTFSPATITIPGNAAGATTITVAANATAKTIPLTFTATSPAVAGSHTATATLTIRPRPPVITRTNPQSLSIGVRSMVVHLFGHDFRPAAIVTATGGVLVEQVNVVSSELADVTLSVPQRVNPGPITLTLTNPDGGSATATLLVYPSSSLGAPLGITAAAIVFPRNGAIIGQSDKVVPRALLATSGTGTITGVWKFDGGVYDTFTVPVTGGEPVAIEGHIAIPRSYNGDHTLVVEVQTPQNVTSPLITILESDVSASQLRVLEPNDGIVMLDGPRRFRWSLAPGAMSYIIEVQRGDRELPLEIRTTESEYDLNDPAAQWGAGIRRWRVRPLFPGEVRGEPTEWRRVAVLPHELKLRFLPTEHEPKSGRIVVRWTGGTPGALYHVIFSNAKGEQLFSAMTSEERYVIPSGQQEMLGGAMVKVIAFGPGGKPLGTTGDKAFTSISRFGARYEGLAFAQLPSQPVITDRLPAEGATVKTDRPRIEVKWTPGVAPDQVTLVIDTTDVTGVSTIDRNSIAYDALLPLGTGSHVVKVSAGGTLASWTFTIDLANAATPDAVPGAATPVGELPQPTIAPTASETPVNPAVAIPAQPAAPLQPPPPSWKGDWLITPLGTLTMLSGDGVTGGDSVHTQLSAQTDLSGGSTFAKITGDTAFKHDLNDPNKTIQESRNWVTRFGGDQLGGKTHEELMLGFAAPDFFDRAELLTMGLARGGVEAKVRLPVGTASYYETVDIRPVGVVAGNTGQEQKIRAAAYEFPVTQKFSLRLVDMDVTEKPGAYSLGGKGNAYGIVGSYAFAPLASLFVEAARGKYTPNGNTTTSTQGTAFRLGLTGSVGTFSYAANVRHTESTFVNPANRGFTPGGIPDRTGADLQLSKMFGTSSFSAQLRHLQDGNSSGATLPRTKETGVALSYSRPLGSKVSLQSQATWTKDNGTATEFAPKTSRVQRGITTTLTENLGRISLTETLGRQQLIDAISKLNNTTVDSATLGVNGTIWNTLSLSTLVSFTRNDAASSGRNDQIVYSLQPAYAIPKLWLTFQPRASYTRSKTMLYGTTSNNEQYQALLSWAPPWLRQIASLQVSSDWTHSDGTNMPATPYTRRYAGTVNLRWGVGHGALDPRPQTQQTNPLAQPTH